MYTGKEGEVNSRMLYPNELATKGEKEKEKEKGKGKGNPQLSTHPTRRRRRLDICRDSQSLEIFVAGDLRELTKVQTWSGII